MLVLRPILVAALMAGSVSAQGLDLEVRGGSVPGTITWELSGGTPFLQAGFILLSTTTGPTPLSLVNPGDPRSLQVGLEFADVAPGGVFLADERFTAPPLPVPNVPALVDSALYFQGISVPGTTALIGDISSPRAVRFGLEDSFRDRFKWMGTGRSFFPLIPLADGKTLLAGGGQGAIFAQIATDQSDVYDPFSDSFTAGPTLAHERSLHTLTQLSDGRWLLIGGVDVNNDPQTTAEIYDPVAHTFTAVASMATPRMAHAAALLPDGRVIVSGGITDLNAPNSAIDPIYSTTDSIEIYDPTANTWSSSLGTTLTKPRAGHAAIRRTDGKVQFIGGLSYFLIFPSIESSTDVYDPALNSVAGGASMRAARGGSGIAPLGNDRWLLVGGVGNISLTQLGTPTAAAEIFDASTGQFTATGSMATARAFPTVVELEGGRFGAFGGGQGALFSATALDTVEIWDPAAGTWSAGPIMTSPRLAASGYATPTGQIHLLGGESTVGVTSTTEFFYQ